MPSSREIPWFSAVYAFTWTFLNGNASVFEYNQISPGVSGCAI